MTEPYRYYVRSPDGRAIFGFESTDAAETTANWASSARPA